MGMIKKIVTNHKNMKVLSLITHKGFINLWNKNTTRILIKTKIKFVPPDI